MKSSNSSDCNFSKEPDLLHGGKLNELPDGSKLPIPYDIGEVANLIRSVHSVSDKERKFIYDTIMVSALETIAPLVELYELIPRIWFGDHIAESKFQNILSENAEGVEIKAFILRGKPNPLDDDDFCNPLFLLKPNAINKIQQASLFLARGDEKKYAENLSIIDRIWGQSLCPGPDTFNYFSYQDQLDGGSRLHEYIESIAETNNYYRRSDEIKEQRIKANSGYDGLTQPPLNEESPWRIPRSGLIGSPAMECGPDDGPIQSKTRIPKNCELIRTWCEDLVRRSARGVRLLPGSVSIANIESIATNQAPACSGDLVTIYGSDFGAFQKHFTVVFGTQVAEVISWSDTEIVVRIPSNATGCIGIRNEKLEEERREAYETNQRAFDEFSEGATACFGQPTGVGMLPYRPDTPQCHDLNIINIGPPSIDFRVNGGWEITVEAGRDNIALEWSVGSADRIEIVRIGSNGPSATITSPMSGSKNLGVFNASSEISATYELRALNRCGTVVRRVSVKAKRTPELEILGIEVTQAIQKFNWDDTSQNNSVKLVSNKLTMVRVYVSSGVTDSFDFGGGPNILPKVTGHLRLTYPSGGSVIVGDILNPGQEISAEPLMSVNRESLDHSLNFILPVNDLDGTLEIVATISAEPRSGDGRYDVSSTSVNFKKSSDLTIVPILVNDTINGNAAPTMADFNRSLQGARTRFPISEAGFRVRFAPSHRVIDTLDDEDLATFDGWGELLERIDDIADDYVNNNEMTWAGLVPKSAAYSISGLGHYDVIFWQDAALVSMPRTATFAHELAHTKSIRHAKSNNGSTSVRCGSPAHVDDSLVSLTEDIGIDVEAYQLMPQGIPTLMTYCAPSFSGDFKDRWISIDLWYRLSK